MPVEALNTSPGACRLPEFGRVRLIRDVDFNGSRFPAGTAGIVVDVYDAGASYEVEFSTPAEEVIELLREDLQAV